MAETATSSTSHLTRLQRCLCRTTCSKAASVAAVVVSQVLSILCVAGSLYVYISMKLGNDFNGSTFLYKNDVDLETPVFSEEAFQEVFLLLAASLYFIWSLMAVLLAVGIAKAVSKLYVPWLLWTGIMLASSVFAILHLLAYMENVYQYVLAEYIVIGMNIAFIMPLSCAVFVDFQSLRPSKK